jgi:hypothetical protein
MNTHSFSHYHILFATNHGKSAAACEPFSRILNTTVSELSIDSDSLGTFTGEIERPGTMIDALRGKVRLAREISSERFILTSEGSFDSAHGFGFFPRGIEMLLLHDAQTGVEVIEQYISLDTNYATSTLKNREDLARFLERIFFSSHAVVLYPDGMPLAGYVYKGITDRIDAEEIFDKLLDQSPTHAVTAMSDMRAHLNPTRMRCIATCCELLAKRLATPCPSCSSGGFGLVATIPGLPCASCGRATHTAQGERHSCPFCKTIRQRPHTDGRTTADPSTCDWCNP